MFFDTNHDPNHERSAYHYVYVVLFYTLFVVADFRFLWPEDHFSALLFLATGLSAIALYETWKIKQIVLGRAISILLFITIGVVDSLIGPIPRLETEYHGWLEPADDPMPLPDCAKGMAEGEIMLALGGAGIVTSPKDKFPVLKIGSCPVLWLTKGPSGLLVDAEIFDAAGTAIARIEQNEWRLAPGQISYQYRPDRSTLIVLDPQAKTVLSVRYSNPRAVRILGTFACPNAGVPLIATEDVIINRGNNAELFGGGVIPGGEFAGCLTVR